MRASIRVLVALVDLLNTDLPNIDLPNIDLPNIDLPNIDLPNIDLPNIDVPTLVLLSFLLFNSGLSSFATAQSFELDSDRLTAERVLGPQWRQLSRRAGMIFAGTVLDTATQTVTDQYGTSQTRANAQSTPSPIPAVQLRFRVDEPIAGVERGQVLTIHEWAGVWSMHRPVSRGQHILIFLYPPSRLGLTSPVGGPLGQVALDPTGKNVAAQRTDAAIGPRSGASLQLRFTADTVSVVQLKRAIRRAREE
jgi:hypothetical protein